MSKTQRWVHFTAMFGTQGDASSTYHDREVRRIRNQHRTCATMIPCQTLASTRDSRLRFTSREYGMHSRINIRGENETLSLMASEIGTLLE